MYKGRQTGYQYVWAVGSACSMGGLMLGVMHMRRASKLVRRQLEQEATKCGACVCALKQ